jgi:hypothetical protein
MCPAGNTSASHIEARCTKQRIATHTTRISIWALGLSRRKPIKHTRNLPGTHNPGRTIAFVFPYVSSAGGMANRATDRNRADRGCGEVGERTSN